MPATPPRSGSTASVARSAGASAWTSSWSTSATTTTREAAGDEVVLFGPGTAGEPTADDWARACGTIHYEIVTPDGRAAEPSLHGSHAVSTTTKALSVAGGLAAGAAAAAAAGTAYRVARRRQVISERGEGDRTPFGSLHSAPITVVTDDGVDLHVEIDEYAGSGASAGGARADRRVHPRLLAQSRLMALPARGLPRPRPLGVLRPALARSVRPLDARPRDDRAARAGPADGPRHRRPAGTGRAGRPLDGRDDDRRAGRGASRSSSGSGSSASA